MPKLINVNLPLLELFDTWLESPHSYAILKWELKSISHGQENEVLTGTKGEISVSIKQTWETWSAEISSASNLKSQQIPAS